MLRLALAAVIALLALSGAAWAAEKPGASSSVGVATMLQNGTILVGVRGPDPDSALQGVLKIEPGDSPYQQIIEHVGGLKPGETKPIPPWPDPPLKKEDGEAVPPPGA